MKKITFSILLLITGIAIFSTSCKKNHDAVSPSSDSPQQFYASQRNEKQVFTYNANKDTVLQGSQGTQISIGAGTLCTASGQPVAGNVTIELKEITKFSDLILNNAPTISKGKLLKSVGTFYISASQNGTALRLVDNANYFIAINAPGGTNDSMSVFTGTDSGGAIVWNPAPKSVSTSNARIATDPGIDPNFLADSTAYFGNTDWGIDDGIYSYIITCNSFGWINSGFYATLPSECNLTFTVDPAFESAYTQIYFTIPSISSIGVAVVDSYFTSYVSESIPDQTAIKIVALTYSNNKYYISTQDYFVNCSAQQPVHLTFQEIAESDIETTLQSINM
jgi:hypothetical protein